MPSTMFSSQLVTNTFVLNDWIQRSTHLRAVNKSLSYTAVWLLNDQEQIISGAETAASARHRLSFSQDNEGKVLLSQNIKGKAYDLLSIILHLVK